MKRILFFLLFFTSLTTFAQRSTPKDPSPVFFGGNFGLNFSNNYWLVNVSPMIGYRLTPPLSIGAGLIYQYERDSRLKYRVHSYGINTFVRYDLSNTLMKDIPFGIFFQTDYDGTQNNIRYDNFPSYNKFINRLFLGAGAISAVGRSRIFVMLSFDMLNLNDSDGVVPLVRGGFIF